ncbi:MAG: GNAT family N-acetyltransferase [Planctomycetes bacterium]|nr:GNAT family N-acetyltransferase [Planctomycetota bacterium]
MSDAIVIRPPRRQQREALIEMTALTFGGPYGPGGWTRFCRDGYLDGSCYDWDTSRIAVRDGRILGHVGIWGHTRLIGRAKVTSGGLGVVCTHADVRGTGLGRRLMEAVLISMRDNGYDTSFMAGLAGFYTHFGWAPSWPRSRVMVQAANLPADGPQVRMRPAPLVRAIRAAGEVGRLYRREQADVVGAAVRPLFTKDHRGWRLHELLTARGGVCGYVASEIDTANGTRTLKVHELGGFSTAAGRRRLLGAIRRLAADGDCKSVVLPCDGDHPLAPSLRGLTCTFVQDYHATGANLIRIINLRSTLRKMAGELAVRLAAGALTGRSGALTIDLPDQAETLVIDRGRVSVAARVDPAAPRVGGTWHAARLLIGADDPQTIIANGGLNCPREAQPWVNALFPRRRHQDLRIDHY